MEQPFKEVVIGERVFRIGRMTAFVGSRILNVLLSATIKAQTGASDAPASTEKTEAQLSFEALSPEERADSAVTAMWIAVGSTVAEDVYAQLQRYAMQVCFLYPPDQQAAPLPLMMANGQWAVADLEKDIKTVNQLIQEALKFNLSEFFTGSASSSPAAATAPAMSQPPIPPARDFSLGR